MCVQFITISIYTYFIIINYRTYQTTIAKCKLNNVLFHTKEIAKNIPNKRNLFTNYLIKAGQNKPTEKSKFFSFLIAGSSLTLGIGCRNVIVHCNSSSKSDRLSGKNSYWSLSIY